jgi:hypothetical protein
LMTDRHPGHQGHHSHLGNHGNHRYYSHRGHHGHRRHHEFHGHRDVMCISLEPHIQYYSYNRKEIVSEPQLDKEGKMQWPEENHWSKISRPLVCFSWYSLSAW